MTQRLISGLIFVGLVALSCSNARAQLIEGVDLSTSKIEDLAAYRDLQTQGKYYILPLALDIVIITGKPAFGVQYFNDPSSRNAKTAVFTMSVTLQARPADMDAAKAIFSASGEAVTIAQLPFHYRLSYFLPSQAGKTPAKTAVSEGNYVAGSTLALTFQVTDTKLNIRGLLSGQAPAFGLLMEVSPSLSFGATRAFRLNGDEIAAEFKSIGYIVANGKAPIPGSNKVYEFLRRRIGLWGAAEETMARRIARTSGT